jgi:hypothetical protein
VAPPTGAEREQPQETVALNGNRLPHPIPKGEIATRFRPVTYNV